MNQYLDIRKAPEPEVVNWENQHVTLFTRFWKTLIVLFIMLVSLVAVLATLAATQWYSNAATNDFNSDYCDN
jgi:predicted negative regulator of RcsB-dependent stress response